jgi:hypothetical protein
MLIIDNDYHMLNLLGIDHALNAVIERYNFYSTELDELFRCFYGGSLSYSNPKYPDAKFSGSFGYNGSKGLEITIRDFMCLRDSEEGFQGGCWIGLKIGHDMLDNGKHYRKKWSRAEAEKLYKTSNQISLF